MSEYKSEGLYLIEVDVCIMAREDISSRLKQEKLDGGGGLIAILSLSFHTVYRFHHQAARF